MGAKTDKLFLEKVNALIESKLKRPQQLKDSADVLISASAHLCLAKSAKRIRPLVCLYFSRLFDDDVYEDLIAAAASAEFIHAASLIHDDIVDSADKRRGMLSVNQSYGNSIAVLAGDFLLTEAFFLMKSFHRDLTNRAIDVIRSMTRASIEELSTRGNLKLNEDRWRNIAIGKTGALFAWCAIAACIFKDKNEHIESLWQAGLHLGLIFQMADDIKDFSGDDFLKDPCRDILNKEPSLPIIIAAKKDDVIKKTIVDLYAKEYITQDDAQKIGQMIIDCGASMQVRALMIAEIEQLLMILKPYQASMGYLKISEFLQRFFLNPPLAPKPQVWHQL